jgi:2,6-dihydroxypyridine 3-monooxygenase
MMHDQPRVVVVGGSLGGLTAALVLRDAGATVDVYERSPAPLHDLGAGIVLYPATVRNPLRHGCAIWTTLVRRPVVSATWTVMG